MSIYERTFGIEIECMLPAGVSRSAVAAAITAAGVEAYDAGYTHARSDKWKIVTDGSLSGGNGMELVSPPLQGAAGHTAIDKVCAVLTSMNAMVNRSCGLHVHVDARALPVKAMRKLAALYVESERIIDSLLPASRRGNNNNFCQSLATADIGRLARAEDATQIAAAINHGNRYVKLNFTSFWRHGTVEFRHHSGTVDASKINNWVKACLRMVATAKKEQDDAIALNSSSQPRPSNARMAIIYDMMRAAGHTGVRREDVAARLGRRTMPPMNRILTQHGIAFREERRGRTARYVLQNVVAAPTTQAIVSFDNWADRIGMEQDEKTFWVARAAALQGSTNSARNLINERA